jgi:hypothetical protein
VSVHQLICPPRSFLRGQHAVGVGLAFELRAKPSPCGLGRCRPVTRAAPPLSCRDARDQHSIIPAALAFAVFVNHG